MTLSQFKETKIILMDIDGHSIPSISSYPEELSNSWIHICKTPMHRQIAYIVSIYHNSDNPKGTIIFSNKIYNFYPDMFVTFDKNGLADKMYTRPDLRKKGYWKWVPLVLRPFFYNNLNKTYVDGRQDRSTFADKAYAKAIKMLGQIPVEQKKFKDSFVWRRDPINDYIWYNKRIEGFLNE
jgi:hypothetical protein